MSNYRIHIEPLNDEVQLPEELRGGSALMALA